MSRQSFLGEESEEVFATVTVGIVGLSGGGSHVVQQTAHIGVKRYVVSDPDAMDREGSNLHRLVGATLDDVTKRTPKVTIAERVIHGINPDAAIVGVRGKWQTNLDAFRQCSVIFGCVDRLSEREQLERFCRRFLIPYIDIGMGVDPVEGWFAVYGQAILSMPGHQCLRCMGIITERKLAEEAKRYGAAGSRPQVVWSNGVLASTAVGIFVQLVTPWHDNRSPVQYLTYDGNRHIVSPRSGIEYILGRRCTHYDPADLGDPLFRVGSSSR